jgi:hypothetical protein
LGYSTPCINASSVPTSEENEGAICKLQIAIEIEFVDEVRFGGEV